LKGNKNMSNIYRKAINELYLKRPIESCPLQEAIDTAMDALEKQIPKKPIMRPYTSAICPACKIELSESKGDGYYSHPYTLKICNCGQKLKWD
jgi:hypothetical protein